MVGRKVGRLVVDAAIRAATLGRILSLRARTTHGLVDYHSPLVKRGIKTSKIQPAQLY